MLKQPWPSKKGAKKNKRTIKAAAELGLRPAKKDSPSPPPAKKDSPSPPPAKKGAKTSKKRTISEALDVTKGPAGEVEDSDVSRSQSEVSPLKPPMKARRRSFKKSLNM